MAFIYVRHGQTPWNVEHRFQGKSDICLNETGKQQAYDTAKALTGLKVKCIYVSPLQRALETANIIKAELQLDVTLQGDERLMERSFGSLEGNVCPPEINLWNGEQLPYDGVESVEDFFQRVQNFIRSKEKEAKEEDILIVAHGGVYLAFYDYFIGFEPNEDRKKRIIPNCKAVRFEVE